jgi:hypothetical protein
METTVFNSAQQHILRMMSFVKDEETISDIREVLKNYFAKKLDNELDQLTDNGEITLDTIENWGKEHMRTPYNKN